MGRRGPKPTPTPILEARGSWLVKRRRGEPRPERGRPACPRWVNREARKIWRALLPRLEAMGVLTKVDGISLARYCVLLEWWVREMAILERHGSSYPVRRNGELLIKTLPAVRIVDGLLTQLNRLEQAFGLTPSARASLSSAAASGRGVQERMDDREKKRKYLRIPSA